MILMNTPVNPDGPHNDNLTIPSTCRDVGWSLPRDPSSASQARKLTRLTLASWNLEALLDETQLMVSELVTNALDHGSGPIGLRFRRGNRLRCEVSDTSPELPQQRDSDNEDESGRGLMIVDALATQWGHHTTSEGPGKTIWFELRLPE